MVKKDYKSLYNLYWWKYKILEDYLIDLEKRYNRYAQGEYILPYPEIVKAREVIAKVRNLNPDQANKVKDE